MGVKWGTPSKVRFIEPTYGIPVELGASGEMNLAVSDARKLIVKIVGTMSGIAWDAVGGGFAKSIKESFRPLIANSVKRLLPTSIKAQNIDVLEIDEHLEDLSEELRNRILDGFEEYGLTIPQFFISEIVLPEEDPNFKRLRELHTVAIQTRMAEAEAGITAARRQIELERQQTETEIAKREAERKLIEAQAEAQAAKMSGFAEAEIMQAKGYNQKDVFQTEVQKAYAEGIGNMGGNGGAGGGLVSDMVGLGVGMAAAGTMSSQMGNMFKGFMNPGESTVESKPEQTIKCSKCGNELPANAKFCLECGTKVEILEANEMICPKCGKKTHKGKFCMECGGSLINTCPKCGAEVPMNGKFCLECGQKLNGGEQNEE
jgi:membrane protease subunit (stomatin/prohibitin family)